MSRVIEDVRGFNRFYTRVIGLLQPDLAGSAFGLTEARVLFELAQDDNSEASDLRRRLDLDAGSLSRILTGFTTARLVTKEQSASDGRRQIVRLTDDGKRAFAELDRLQTVALDKLLAPLDGSQRKDLVASMGRIRRMLGDEPRWAGLVFRPPAPGDLGWVVAQHGQRYAADHGWDVTFEALAARIVADFAERNDTRREAGWIAEVDCERGGSVFCTCSEWPDTALMRLLLVEPSARGAGIGTRLVDECLRFARRAGYERILLWTNDVLANARSIYLRAGFQLDRRDPHHSFGHDLVGEYWSREL